MTKRESNAERLARSLWVEPFDSDSEEIQDIICILDAHRITKEQFVPHAQKLLDILASWRTCGSCKYWVEPEPGKEMDFLGVCTAELSGPDDPKTTRVDWTCGYWEEREDG